MLGNSADPKEFNIIKLTFYFILFAIYGGVFIFNTCKLVPILKIPNKRPFFISFYLSLYFLYLFRALSFGMVFFLQLASQQTLEQETPEDTYKILFNSYDAPRCLQTMAYIFFLFLIFHIEHECHFDSIELEKNPPITRNIRFGSVVWICALILGNFVILSNVLYAIDEILFSSLLLSIIINASVVIVTFVGLEYYKSYYFSGFPYLNKRAETTLSFLKRIFCFWIMGKVIDITLCLYLILSSKLKEQEIQDYMKGDSFVGLLLYVVYIVDLMITEVWPGGMVLERSFLKVFIKKRISSNDSSKAGETDNAVPGFYVVPNEGNDSSIIQSEPNRARSGSFHKPKVLKITALSQLKLTDEPRYYRAKGLGTIYVGDSELGPVRVRKLGVGSHQIREAAEEVKRWRKLAIKGIENLYGEYHEDETLYIISEAREDYTTLAQVIKYQSKLPEKQKCQIFVQLVRILLQLEVQGDLFSHGHLCPSNILVDNEMKKVIIQDFGFLNCKAYVSMVGNSQNKEDVYENKDKYTAPENLTQKGNSVKKPTHKADIYSLSVIMLELFSGKFVFEDATLPFIVKSVVEEKIRPKIPETFNPQLIELIKSCWATNPLSRPGYTQILEALSKISSDYN